MKAPVEQSRNRGRNFRDGRISPLDAGFGAGPQCGYEAGFEGIADVQDTRGRCA